MTTELKGISIYVLNEEKELFEKLAKRENKTVSTWLRNYVNLSLTSTMTKYKDEWYESAAKYNMRIEEFINYSIEMLEHVHIQNDDLLNSLKKENTELKARLYVLEHPAPPVDKYKDWANKIFNLIDGADGRWVSEKEILANFDIQNESDHEDYLIARHTFEINYVQDGQFEFNRNRFRKVV